MRRYLLKQLCPDAPSRFYAPSPKGLAPRMRSSTRRFHRRPKRNRHLSSAFCRCQAWREGDLRSSGVFATWESQFCTPTDSASDLAIRSRFCVFRFRRHRLCLVFVRRLERLASLPQWSSEWKTLTAVSHQPPAESAGVCEIVRELCVAVGALRLFAEERHVVA